MISDFHVFFIWKLLTSVNQATLVPFLYTSILCSCNCTKVMSIMHSQWLLHTSMWHSSEYSIQPLEFDHHCNVLMRHSRAPSCHQCMAIGKYRLGGNGRSHDHEHVSWNFQQNRYFLLIANHYSNKASQEVSARFVNAEKSPDSSFLHIQWQILSGPIWQRREGLMAEVPHGCDAAVMHILWIEDDGSTTWALGLSYQEPVREGQDQRQANKENNL